MANHSFNLMQTHSSWAHCLQPALNAIDPDYLKQLTHSTWLPGPDKIFNAFSLPLNQVNYVLFGESPYPRSISANGYAFWDAAVNELWSPSGLSKQVNRATSLRNLIKMLLIADGKLDAKDTSQEAIAKIDKSDLVQTNNELFNNLLAHGFLLLNATPVLSENAPQKDARAWLPFMSELLHCFLQNRPEAKFILFGRIASTIDPLITEHHQHNLYAEHPYNVSFITNPKVLAFFRPLKLLKK